MATELEQTQQVHLAYLKTVLGKVAARMLTASADAQPGQWRLMGRCLGRVEKSLSQVIMGENDVNRLNGLAPIILDAGSLESQVKSAYLFAKDHSLGELDGPAFDKQMQRLSENGDGDLS